MKIYSKSHARALQLKREMDSIQTQHELHIKFQQRNERARFYRVHKKANDESFLIREKVFEAQENEAYEKYYRYMHENFDINNSPINFLDYKDGFADEKYINALFKLKHKEAKRKK